jgi:hypothetical protein
MISGVLLLKSPIHFRKASSIRKHISVSVVNVNWLNLFTLLYRLNKLNISEKMSQTLLEFKFCWQWSKVSSFWKLLEIFFGIFSAQLWSKSFLKMNDRGKVITEGLENRIFMKKLQICSKKLKSPIIAEFR